MKNAIFAAILSLSFAAGLAQASESIAPAASVALFDTNTHDAWADAAGLTQWNRTNP